MTNEQIIADISHAAWRVGQAADVCAQEIASYHASWHSVLRPKLFKDGNMWCALYGANLQVGISGFGETPAKALFAFEIAMCSPNGAHVVENTSASQTTKPPSPKPARTR